MQAQNAATSPLFAALRIAGATGGAVIVLLVLAALSRPEMVMDAMHAVMQVVR